MVGYNDPRVPWTEGEQIVKSLKAQSRPVWFMVAKDEGHGYAKKPNQDYQFYATVEFAKRTLLK
jgi:dipeptidyl aminopeptidase/acylaminoacyl peptidase